MLGRIVYWRGVNDVNFSKTMNITSDDRNIRLIELARFAESLEKEITDNDIIGSESNLIPKTGEDDAYTGCSSQITHLAKLLENYKILKGTFAEVLEDSRFDKKIVHQLNIRIASIGKSIVIIYNKLQGHKILSLLLDYNPPNALGSDPERAVSSSEKEHSSIETLDSDVLEYSGPESATTRNKSESEGNYRPDQTGPPNDVDTSNDYVGVAVPNENQEDDRYSAKESSEWEVFSSDGNHNITEHDFIATHKKLQEELIEKLSRLSLALAESSVSFAKNIQGDAVVVEKAAEYLMGNTASMGREGKRIDFLNARIDRTSRSTMNIILSVIVLFVLTYAVIRIFP